MKYYEKLSNSILESQNTYQCHYTTLIYEAPSEQLWDGAKAGAAEDSKLRANVGYFIFKSQNYLKQQVSSITEYFAQSKLLLFLCFYVK